eukprot:TRINITY_DN1622_c0_g1_i4.p1 TRINITY_DN1622_c0_g1~~TRINITY_DN1622_c0_g1_i4.p1  ORF type:complete len:311 (-),score=9.84 TRINITY_DN1622_c0_g1_i4:567-1499(-)
MEWMDDHALAVGALVLVSVLAVLALAVLIWLCRWYRQPDSRVAPDQSTRAQKVASSSDQNAGSGHLRPRRVSVGVPVAHDDGAHVRPKDDGAHVRPRRVSIGVPVDGPQPQRRASITAQSPTRPRRGSAASQRPRRTSLTAQSQRPRRASDSHEMLPTLDSQFMNTSGLDAEVEVSTLQGQVCRLEAETRRLQNELERSRACSVAGATDNELGDALAHVMRDYQESSAAMQHAQQIQAEQNQRALQSRLDARAARRKLWQAPAAQQAALGAMRPSPSPHPPVRTTPPVRTAPPTRATQRFEIPWREQVKE